MPDDRHARPEESPQYPVWDLPTRAGHWLLSALFLGALLSAWFDARDAHEWIGLAILGLLVFRLLWGFVGSIHSRFADFLVGPGRLLDYLRGRAEQRAGHNPMGGLSVLLMLLALLVQTVTGLFNTDEVFYEGPWYPAVGADTAGVLGAAHAFTGNALLGLVTLHITAVFWHERRHSRRLIRAMINGRGASLPGAAPPVPGWRAVLALLLSIGVLSAILLLAPEPVSYGW